MNEAQNEKLYPSLLGFSRELKAILDPEIKAISLLGVGGFGHPEIREIVQAAINPRKNLQNHLGRTPVTKTASPKLDDVDRDRESSMNQVRNAKYLTARATAVCFVENEKALQKPTFAKKLKNRPPASNDKTESELDKAKGVALYDLAFAIHDDEKVATIKSRSGRGKQPGDRLSHLP